MNLMIEGNTMAAKPIMPMRTRTGMLRNTPIITGTGATNMINIHLKNVITTV